LLRQEDCARVLMFRGANTELKNSTGHTAYQVAVAASYHTLADAIHKFKPSDVGKLLTIFSFHVQHLRQLRKHLWQSLYIVCISWIGEFVVQMKFVWNERTNEDLLQTARPIWQNTQNTTHSQWESERVGQTQTRNIRQRQTNNHTKVKLDKLQYKVHYNSQLGKHALSSLNDFYNTVKYITTRVHL